MQDKILEQVLQAAADVFNVPAETLTGDSSPSTVASWDSLQNLNLRLELETHFAIHLSPAESEQMSTLRGVADVIHKKLG